MEFMFSNAAGTHYYRHFSDDFCLMSSWEFFEIFQKQLFLRKSLGNFCNKIYE